ncbi:MAG: putative Adenylate kinase [Candidatus Saccharibacteria bacterium]|nr:putative Adenylate kinase [Candidatus Saccharibacteria bacterium]
MEDTIRQWLGSGSINLFGLPYAGKDTQAELLAKEFDGIRLSGGEIIRNSIVPPHVKEAQESGALIPTQDYINIVLPYLARNEFSGKPLILSSVGRWHGEEDGVIEALTQSGHNLKAAVFLTIDEEILYQRWSVANSAGGRNARADDERDKISLRLAEFREKTLPVIDYYRDLGLLIEIDANKHVIDVCRDIIDALANRSTVN